MNKRRVLVVSNDHRTGVALDECFPMAEKPDKHHVAQIPVLQGCQRRGPHGVIVRRIEERTVEQAGALLTWDPGQNRHHRPVVRLLGL